MRRKGRKAKQQGFADSDEVASFGDEVIANRLFRTRGLQGMWAAATRCLRERQARLNAAAANLKGLAMLARGSLGMWAAAGMLPTGRFATDKVVASATFHKEVCPCPMRSKVLACTDSLHTLKYLGMGTGSCEFAGSCCEAGAGRRFLAPPSHT